jgi:hypothetical protein
MKTLFVTLAVALFTFGCNGQSPTNKGTDKKEANKEEKNVPKESWTVKKEMDENGNVIGYDSTYTWSYSTANGDSMTINVDSMLQSMHSYFGNTMPSLWDRNFMDPMMRDSLLPHDLFSDNYFEQRWKDQYFDMDKMFQEMDSLRNLFFEEQFPDMKLSPPVRSKPENN